MSTNAYWIRVASDLQGRKSQLSHGDILISSKEELVSRRTPHLLIVDDHRSSAEATALAIKVLLGWDDASLAFNFEDGKILARKHHPDVVLVDRYLDDGDGFMLPSQLRAELPQTRWLGYSAEFPDDPVLAARECGLNGIVSKRSGIKEVIEGISAVLLGRFFVGACANPQSRQEPTRAGEMSTRERQIISGFRRGLNCKQIAEEVGVATKTIQNGATLLKERTGSPDVAALARLGRVLGL